MGVVPSNHRKPKPIPVSSLIETFREFFGAPEFQVIANKFVRGGSSIKGFHRHGATMVERQMGHSLRFHREYRIQRLFMF